MIPLPDEIYDAITARVEGFPRDDDPYQVRFELVRKPRSRGKILKDLSTLRLLNKPFCQSASTRLFRFIEVAVDSHAWQTDWPLARLLALCNSPYAPFVRRLRIGYMSPGEEEDWEPGNRFRMYAEDAARLLPVCLSRLSRLEVLDVDGPDFMAPDVPVVSQMQLFTDAVVSTLRYVQLPCLVELNLRLAVTREYEEFFCDYPTPSRIPIGHVMQRLRHLEIAVHNSTDHAWQLERQSPRWSQPSLSGLRETWPNADFLASPLRLIELATGLESLSVCGADIHDMDPLRLGSEVCLKDLKLSNIAMSAETMIRMLGQCRHSLRGVVFFCVELNSGTWADVLNALRNFNQLYFLHIDGCGYPPREEVRRQRIGGRSVIPGEVEIYGLSNTEDYYALASAQRLMVANRTRAGMSPYPEGGPHTWRIALRPGDPVETVDYW